MEVSKAYQDILSEISEKQREIVQQNQLIAEIEVKKCGLRNDIAQLNHQLNLLPIGINSVPDEVLGLICENFLDFRNLLKCQKVCRRWFCVIGSKLNGLVICGNAYGRSWDKEQELKALRGQRWFHSSNTMINTNFSISIQRTYLYSARFTSFDPAPIKSPFLLNLRRLYVTTSLDRPAWNLMRFVSDLTSLEELELGQVHTESERPVRFWIKCPNLKSLVIRDLWPRVDIEIESKILKFKTYSHLGRFTFKHPDELRELHLMREHIQPAPNLRFNGLEVLKCTNGLPESTWDQLFEYSVGLRNLQLGLTSDLTHYGWTAKSAQNVLRLKEAFKRSELNIVFYGIQLNSEEQFAGFDSGDNRRLIKLLMKNYIKLTDLTWLDHISYSYLTETDELPKDFHIKFSAIKELRVHKVVKEPARLIEFLKNSKSLRSLKIENSSLDECFYREIDSTLIRKLKIDESACKIRDFSFILQLQKLDCFEANLERPLDMIQRGMDYLREVTGMGSTPKAKFIKIERNNIGFELTIDKNLVHRKTYTAMQLIEELAKL